MSPTHGLRVAREIVRHLFARERLSEDPVASPFRPPRPSLLRLLFAPETLPQDPERRPAPRAGILSALFRREQLGEAPAPAPRPPRRSWLRTLLAPERLDPP
jgi:hypothetical protein